MEYVLAVDIGASSGRHIITYRDGSTLKTEEIYRFSNQMIRVEGHDVWDVDRLFEEILKGMRQCAKIDKIPKSVAIDTWACDFVLCDEVGKRMGDCISYRDHRVEGVMEKVHQLMTRVQLYEITGIQFQKFNTLYQLLALKKQDPKQLQKAKHFLMVPDYFNYCLTGNFVNEFSNASTTQLMDVHSGVWSSTILDAFDLPKNIFHTIQKPGTSIGYLTDEIRNKVGFNCEVILCASHDTGSAFASATSEKSILISSGTWSLLGVLLDKPRCDQNSAKMNFTNESGCFEKIRYLKNIMGLWIIQEVYRQYDGIYRYDNLVHLARKETSKDFLIDVNEECFLHPEDMILEIQNACIRGGMDKPSTPGEIAWCVYNSLADAYQKAIEELEDLLDEHYEQVQIFGGGCQNSLLNETLARKCGKKVSLGFVEASAIGNVMIQQIYHKVLTKDEIQTIRIENVKEKEVYYEK